MVTPRQRPLDRAGIMNRSHTRDTFMNEATRAYLAALVDGEGCIVVTRIPSVGNSEFPFQFTPRLMVTNSHLGLLKFVQRLTGFGVLYSAKARPSNPNWSPMHRWTCRANQCKALAASLLPYLVIKRRHAEIVLNFPKRNNRARNRQAMYDHQKALFDEIAALNRRGLKDAPVDTYPADHPLLTGRS